MKFRIKVKDRFNKGWWETMDKYVGENTKIRGFGYQPVFTGDINKFGKDIVAWFNKDCKPENKRTFLAAELLTNDE